MGKKIHLIEIKGGATFNYDWLKGILYLETIARGKIQTQNVIYAGKDSLETKNTHVCSYKSLGKLFKNLAD